MRSIEWSFYDPATGVLAPLHSLLPEGVDPQGFAPPGHKPYAGRLDHRSRRVDVAAAPPADALAAAAWQPPVVAWQPPAPPDDALQTWAWDEQARRWMPRPTAAALQQQRAAELRDQITVQEAAQARPMREVLIALAAGKQPPAAAVQRLAAIEQAVAPLRLQVQAVSAAVESQSTAA
jgi:hypothetical protein